ncbi:hypothetical protein GF322_04635 [Candidatus Dependentiae bacterium]|nr:hypothetical protein [Candidatus Dependentiae bacterium]
MKFSSKNKIFSLTIFLFSCFDIAIINSDSSLQKISTPSMQEDHKEINNNQETPRLTVILIIDQFAYHHVPKLKKYFKYGLKTLIENGIFYTNAKYKNAAPSTPAGHATIATGTLPCEHGFALGYWLDSQGNKIKIVSDDKKQAGVFSKNGLYDYGISATNLMVDTIVDQFILSSQPFENHQAFAFSLKPYATLPLAGQLGKAFWFDQKSIGFTSSKAYVKKIPKWLKEFNTELKLDKLKETSWKLCYPVDDPAYSFKYINDYNHAGFEFSLIKNPQKIDFSKEEPFEFYIKTPACNQLILDIAKTCLDKNLSENPKDKFLLAISLSPLDKLAHNYGPDSLEVVDMIYHIDNQIGNFIKYTQEKVGASNVLFVLTADHGVAPIPEIMQAQGYKKSIRIFVKPLIEQMNKIVEKNYGISNFVIDFKKIYFFINKQKIKNLENTILNEILNDLKNFLSKQPGIKKVWTNDELDYFDIPQNQIEFFFKASKYPGRTGELICQPEPYCVLTKYKTGTSHRSPYDYDTHVPLIIYQKDWFEKQIFNEQVCMTQLAPTLAKILNISKPSASTYATLPGI